MSILRSAFNSRTATFLNRRGLITVLALLAFSLVLAQNKPEKAKLPKSRILENTVQVARDPATGELHARTANEVAGPRSEIPAIRARVALVSVACSVTGPDGANVRGLTRDDFRVFEDGAEQTIAAFDAATSPASIAVVLDASPSIYREFGEMRDVARSLSHSLAPQDEVAVVAFAAETHLLLPFSRDRELLAAALASPELARVATLRNHSSIRRFILLHRNFSADGQAEKPSCY